MLAGLVHLPAIEVPGGFLHPLGGVLQRLETFLSRLLDALGCLAKRLILQALLLVGEVGQLLLDVPELRDSFGIAGDLFLLFRQRLGQLREGLLGLGLFGERRLHRPGDIAAGDHLADVLDQLLLSIGPFLLGHGGFGQARLLPVPRRDGGVGVLLQLLQGIGQRLLIPRQVGQLADIDGHLRQVSQPQEQILDDLDGPVHVEVHLLGVRGATLGRRDQPNAVGVADRHADVPIGEALQRRSQTAVDPAGNLRDHLAHRSVGVGKSRLHLADAPQHLRGRVLQSRQRLGQRARPLACLPQVLQRLLEHIAEGRFLVLEHLLEVRLGLVAEADGERAGLSHLWAVQVRRQRVGRPDVPSHLPAAEVELGKVQDRLAHPRPQQCSVGAFARAQVEDGFSPAGFGDQLDGLETHVVAHGVADRQAIVLRQREGFLLGANHLYAGRRVGQRLDAIVRRAVLEAVLVDHLQPPGALHSVHQRDGRLDDASPIIDRLGRSGPGLTGHDKPRTGRYAAERRPNGDHRPRQGTDRARSVLLGPRCSARVGGILVADLQVLDGRATHDGDVVIAAGPVAGEHTIAEALAGRRTGQREPRPFVVTLANRGHRKHRVAAVAGVQSQLGGGHRAVADGDFHAQPIVGGDRRVPGSDRQVGGPDVGDVGVRGDCTGQQLGRLVRPEQHEPQQHHDRPDG